MYDKIPGGAESPHPRSSPVPRFEKITCDAMWRKYCQLCGHSPEDPIVLRMRNVFYAGMACMFQAVTMDATDGSEEAACQILSSIDDELRRFAESVLAQHGGK